MFFDIVFTDFVGLFRIFSFKKKKLFVSAVGFHTLGFKIWVCMALVITKLGLEAWNKFQPACCDSCQFAYHKVAFVSGSK